MSKIEKQEHSINLNLNVRGLKPSATLAINELSNKMRAAGKKVYKFGLGQSPFPVPAEVVKSLQKHASEKDYLPVKGLPQLRESIANFILKTQHVKATADDVLVGPGSKELIFILQLVYYGDLIIPTPSWVSYFPQAYIIGRHVHWVPTKLEDGYRLSPKMLEEICQTDPDRPRVVILNYPSNPTGCTYKLERLKELAKVARKYKVILISDEIYGLLHHQAQHVSIARFYPEGTIISTGLSKWCGAGGWRLGTFIFPKELYWLRDAMAIVASETYTSTSAPVQFAAVTAFNGSPTIDKYLEDSRLILRTMAKYIRTELINAHINVPQVNGGFYLFPDFSYYRDLLETRKITTATEMCSALLEETGVAMLPGTDFGHKEEELLARLAYVNFDGQLALNNADMLQNGNNNINKFMIKCCPEVVEGVAALTEWFIKLSEK
ncbi:MAG: aminotransferase class I/II-fold pyridoxal phosphate-dependent enzyme [Bacteroidales bacterium]|nr:aminotransferase class I/II-fold pyridoxal phosphate-dependent enzyme [Bacteroidales bacterium]